MSDNYISVSQLNMYIKNIFDSEVMLQNICVYGEVSSYNISNGIAYFNLKDENGLLQCVLFGANQFDSPKIGDMVLVCGSMNYYVKGGKLSFNATSIMPYGKGLLYEKFLKLKEKLESLGYFANERKKEIPSRVQRIGVVTSQTGAVIRDIIDVTTRRNDTVDIVLFPVRVQGVGAEFEIARGIEFFSNYDNIDVIIVARGGGSIEDLEPFNTEIVANAVYNCKKPLVSAVGHETDFTIIDFVADLRAPTPSAAAELVVWEKNVLLDSINKVIYDMSKLIENKINFCFKEIELCYQKYDNFVSVGVSKYDAKLLDCLNKLDAIKSILDNNEFLLSKLNLQIDNLNPEKISKMGYSKISQGGKTVSLLKNIDKSKEIKISMLDGCVDCSIIRG